jgi:hypothetical protein
VETLEDYAQIKEATFQHYKSLFTEKEEEDSVPNEEEMTQHITNKISKQENQNPLQEITEEELGKVVWSFEKDKAMGLDRFTFHFFKAVWDTIKRDLSVGYVLYSLHE